MSEKNYKNSKDCKKCKYYIDIKYYIIECKGCNRNSNYTDRFKKNKNRGLESL